MKVAILGAGLSGLSCAIILEQNGIYPDIYEKRNCVGDRFVNSEALFSILNRPIKDCLAWLTDNYNITLNPISRVESLLLHSKNEEGTISGNIGYTNIRGRHDMAFEVQLSKMIKSPIKFNVDKPYEELCKEYNYVIMATGDGLYSSQLGNYKSDLTCTIRSALITGNFKVSEPHVWFNYDIIPQGYGWVIPYNDKEANLVLAYPDTPENIQKDINVMWEEYWNVVSNYFHQSFEITDKFEITKYMVGICNKPKIDNTYFVGNCFGTMTPGLGFGQFTSILTGIYCAQDICGTADYDDLTKPLMKQYNHSLELRRFLESLSNKQLDFFIKNLDNVLTDKIIDDACNMDTSIDYLKILTPLMKLWNKAK